jgi:hypothetical protein
MQQEGNAVSTGYRSFEAKPANDARAIDDKIDAERGDDDDVDDVPDQAAQKR